MKTSLSRLLTVAAALLAGATSPLAAQQCWQRSCTTANAVQVHVGTVLRLSLQGATTVVATADQAAVQRGAQAAVGPTAVVRSNGQWKLEISAAQPVWTPASPEARADKPAADLAWSTRPGDGFTSVETVPAAVSSGGPTNGATLPLYYQTRFTPQSDTPGTYALAVRLTLVGD
jgi:hypothetical protein